MAQAEIDVPLNLRFARLAPASGSSFSSANLNFDQVSSLTCSKYKINATSLTQRLLSCGHGLV